MDLKFINHHLEGIKKQHEMVKYQETYVITSMTVEFLINSLSNVINEYETIRKQRTWYKNRYDRLQDSCCSTLLIIGKTLRDDDKDLSVKLQEIHDLTSELFSQYETD